MASTLPRLPIFEAISKHNQDSPAIVHSDSGRTFSYGDLLHDVARRKYSLATEVAGSKPLKGERVAFLVENGYDYVVTFLAIIANQAIALPLAPSFPVNELRYILNNSQAIAFLNSEKNQEKADELLKEDVDSKPARGKIDETIKSSSKSAKEDITLEDHGEDKGGMMLYTSGTTSRPKGVLLPNTVLTAQAHSLHKAWNYSSKDRLLHCLPLHHIHGCMNALYTPLLAGTAIEFLFPFKADLVWKRLAAPFQKTAASQENQKVPITFFTVVPTIYSLLLKAHPDLPEDVQTASKEAISSKNLRLAMSGSSALPTSTKKSWSELSSNNILLERYGMTEVGMALSCGLAAADRVDGSVGWPLPSVEARLVDTDKQDAVISMDQEDVQGEIQLRGPTIFAGYFNNEAATKKEFVEGDDGKGKWFKTGDVALRKTVKGAGQNKDQQWASGPMYFIQGRASADIIKTGGEKVSALEVEREMLALSQVGEVAVVPVDSEKWGQKVAAVVVLSDEGKTAGKDGKAWSPLDMRKTLKEKLVGYKIPQEMKVVDEIAKNAMGKVNKKNLVKELWG